MSTNQAQVDVIKQWIKGINPTNQNPTPTRRTLRKLAAKGLIRKGRNNTWELTEKAKENFHGA